MAMVSVLRNDEMIFLYELLMCPEERQLLAAIRDKPDDASLRAVYGDFLEECQRDASAKLVREGFTPATAGKEYTQEQVGQMPEQGYSPMFRSGNEEPYSFALASGSVYIPSPAWRQ